MLDDIPRVQDLRWVQDGEELMDYLLQRGEFKDPAESPPPDLVLLDLNMPRKDGRTVLREIKEDPRLRCLPIIVLTTSDADHDIETSYELGANSYIIKRDSFKAFRDVMEQVTAYWFGVVRLPEAAPAGRTSDAPSTA